MTTARVDRRLAAILAADVAGYSRLMGSDEEGTLGAAEGLPQGAGRSEDRRASRPHRQDHRRRPAGRVRQRRRRGALRRRGAARHGRAQRRRAAGASASSSASASMSATSSSTTTTSSATASTSRRGSKASPSPAASASRMTLTARCAARSTIAFDDHGRADAQEHRPAGAGLCALRAPSAAAAVDRAGARARPARQAVDRRAAVPEHERRSRAGIFRRRHGRGHHHRAVALQVAVRHRAQFELHLQGQGGRRQAGRPRARRALRARRQRAQGRQPGAHHRPADRCSDRRASVGRPLRRRPRGHLRASG